MIYLKIVHIEGFFHASAGYQINILPKYLAKMGHEQYILTGELDQIPERVTKFFGKNNVQETDEKYVQENNVKIIRLPLRGYISGRVIFGPELDREINIIKPDVIYVHGNDTVYGMKYIYKYKKEGKTLLITDSHMLDIASKNRLAPIFQMFYRFFITPKIIKNNIKVIRTQNDTYVEKKLGIPLDQAPWIPTGSDLLLFYPDKEIKQKFKTEHKLRQNSFIVVYAGKLDEAKGGSLLAEVFRKKFNTNREVVLLCIGNSVGEYGEKIESILKKSENRIIRYSTQPYINLAKFFQSSDIAVFPKQSSLSFYDAQASGLPVILENKSINTERIQYHNGLEFKSDDVEDFRAKIEFFANLNEEDFYEYKKNSIRYVKDKFNYETIAERYEQIIVTEYNRLTGKMT